MYKKRYHLKSGMRKFSIALLSGVMAVSLGLAAACTVENDDDDNETTTSPTDTQTILNGNFEFFNDSDDKTHIIYTPNNWSASTSGQTNYSMNGIIDTSASGWDTISADDLADRLEDNYNLDPDDENYDEEYVDYNGMRKRDIPYANPHSAINDDEDADLTLIDNPLTHDVITEGSDNTATYVDENGETVTLYADENGDYFTDEELTEPYESHVLMVHNYRNLSYRYGTAQTYTSSSTISLEPNTAAEISVWVKTSDLMYNRNGETPEEGLGAFIAVEQTVGSTTIDTFYIDAINTAGVTENNGWVQYTIFVQGCDFATSSITVEVGLGRADDDGDYSRTLEGYAFFDDITCTLYSDISESENYQAAVDAGYLVNSDTHDESDTVCTITDNDDEKVFSYDNYKNRADFDEGYGRNFLIDLAWRQGRTDSALNSSTVSAALTKDSDNYVTSSSTPSFINVGTGDNGSVHMNYGLDINTSSDVIGSFTLSGLSQALSDNSSIVGKYDTLIEDAFANAQSLPGADSDSTALMLLSARGAAYTAEISGSDGSFTVAPGGHKIVSMWVKTSDMNGYTAATIKIYDANNEDVSATLTADTTGITFDVGDEEDIYDGWLQCFFFIENTLDEEMTFKLDFSFGNTTIYDTTSAAYKSGWAAITNIQTFDVEEDVFDLASTGSYAASFSFTETDNRENSYMDDVYGALNNNIENNISRPSSYNGAYGASASVVYKEDIDADGYDGRNNNENAGLINQDHFYSYIQNAQEDSSTYVWLNELLESKGLSLSSITAAERAAEIWNEIFGTETIQPLLIVNTVKTFADAAAMNYGFMASSATTVSSASYQAVSVRVKVSAGAAAYVYLTENGDRTSISSCTLPRYSFWYDNRGNVLDSEPDYDDQNYDASDHVVYYIRNDGLYEDSEGNLFANMYNYSREYYDESVEYYAAGSSEPTAFEDLDPDTIYYTNASDAVNGTGNQAPHYLVASDSTRVFRYENGEYRYIIVETDDEGNATLSYSEPVENFVIGSENGGVDLRYDNTDNSKQLYTAVDARYDANGRLFGGATAETADISELGYDADGNYVADTWQTVTFYIHTGDQSVSYSLELWSGARETSGVTANGDTYTVNNDGSVPGSYVMFDHSDVNVDESGYSTLTSAYSSQIIRQYIELFRSEGLLAEGSIDSSEENISYYEAKFDEFVASGDLEESQRPAGYSAMYYTYSLYDDQGYVPFNAETAADGETGYDYTADDYSETLVYLGVNDYEHNAVNVFVDYSATDVTVDIGTSDGSDDTEDDHDHTTGDTNVWLLVVSIILAVALIFTLVSIFIRDLLKKKKRTKNFGKNIYAGKRKHYIRKLGITESAVEENEATPAENTESNSQAEVPAETAGDAAEATEVPAEVPAEETPVEGDGETPAEQSGDSSDEEKN